MADMWIKAVVECSRNKPRQQVAADGSTGTRPDWIINTQIMGSCMGEKDIRNLDAAELEAWRDFYPPRGVGRLAAA